MDSQFSANGLAPSKAKLDLTYLSPINSNSTEKAKQEGEEGKNEKREEDEGDSIGATKTAFDQLILPDGHREMVLSLIAQHFRDKDSAKSEKEQVDLVRGKGKTPEHCFSSNQFRQKKEGPNSYLGKGLIILLHGLPGVGKTTTAGECHFLLFTFYVLY